MTKTRRLLLGLMAATSLAAVAADGMAQPPQGRRGPPPGAPGGPGPEQRVQQLRTQLSLTPAQENAFQAFIAATAPPAPGERREERRQMQGLTAPQRLDAQLAEAAQRQADLKTRADAAKRFYAALTVDQRAVFDNLPPPAMLGIAPGGRGGPGRMAMQGGPRGEGQRRGPGGQGPQQDRPGAWEDR